MGHQDKQYLDALSGVAVCNLGHAHPAVTRAVCEQAGRLLHTSNIYGIAAQEDARRHADGAGRHGQGVFGNPAPRANEAAIAGAPLRAPQGTRSPMIVVMENSFHGRTLATLSATGNRKVQAGFEPLVQGFIRVPYGDLAALQAVADNQQDVVAVLVEPIQGEAASISPPDYLPGVRALCDSKGLADDPGRDPDRHGTHRQTVRVPALRFQTGRDDAGQGAGQRCADRACLARGEAAELFAPGNHGSTFGGNPLACAAALTVCRTSASSNVGHRSQSRRTHHGWIAQRAGQRAGRDRGARPGPDDRHRTRPAMRGTGGRALEQGLLINVTADSVVRLLPPW